jgi:hypothetical protein
VVEAAFREPWSSGQVEGTINKLKLLKRRMYDRANVELLEAYSMTAVQQVPICMEFASELKNQPWHGSCVFFGHKRRQGYGRTLCRNLSAGAGAAAFALFAVGLAGLGAAARRRRKTT